MALQNGSSPQEKTKLKSGTKASARGAKRKKATFNSEDWGTPF